MSSFGFIIVNMNKYIAWKMEMKKFLVFLKISIIKINMKNNLKNSKILKNRENYEIQEKVTKFD